MQTKCRVDENQMNGYSGVPQSQQSLSKNNSKMSSNSELLNSDKNDTVESVEEEVSSSISEIRNSKISKSVSSELSEVSEQQEKDSSSSDDLRSFSNGKRPIRKSGVASFDNLGLLNLREYK